MVDNTHYEVWIKTSCSYCLSAQRLLLENAKSHSLYVMDDKLDELEEVKKLWNHRTVPLVLLRNGDEEKFIGGYTDLQEHLDSNKIKNDWMQTTAVIAKIFYQ